MNPTATDAAPDAYDLPTSLCPVPAAEPELTLQQHDGDAEDHAPPSPPVLMPIDSLCLGRFLQLAGCRKRRPPKSLNKDGTRVIARWQTGAFGYCVAAPGQSLEALDPLIAKVHHGPLLSRLLFALHARVLTDGQATVTLEEGWLANMLWGEEVVRPPNWRASLARTITTATILRFTYQKDGQTLLSRPVCAKVSKLPDAHAVIIDPILLGMLGDMVGDNGRLNIVRSHPNPDAKVTNKDLKELRARNPDYYNYLPREELETIVRSQREENARQPSLQNIGRAGRLATLFLPAALGHPAVCRELGRLAILLVNEKTRARAVEHAKVPGWSGPAMIVCPFLDEKTKYIAFAANAGRPQGRLRSNRQGRGYLLATWAKKLGVTLSELLEQLAAAAPRLGLITAGLDADGRWYDLAAIRAADADVRDRLNVRVYTVAEDYITRWCKVFGWGARPRRLVDGGDAAAASGEIADLASVVRDRGVRSAARGIGIDAANLSKILAGKRMCRPDLMARIRRFVRGSQPLGGTGAGTIFGGCHSPLDFAMAYRTLGWSVIPVVPGTKKPHVYWTRYQTFLPAEREIREWWMRWPDAGIGLILGPCSGVFAVDVDGKEAHDVLLGHLGSEPIAPKSRSGDGDPHRLHLFFRYPELPAKAKTTPWHEKLEFRGNRAILILPPSLHRSGNRYQWVCGEGIEERPLTELPEQIAAELIAASERAASLKAVSIDDVEADQPVPARGNRGGRVDVDGKLLLWDTMQFLLGAYADGPKWNGRLFNAACDMNAQGYPERVATRFLMNGAKPWDEVEAAAARRTIASAFSRPRT